MSNETSFALLGALIAVAVVLLVVVIFVGTIAKRAIGYAGRFKGFQANRNVRGEMTFGGIVDETPIDDDGYRVSILPPSLPPDLVELEDQQKRETH